MSSARPITFAAGLACAALLAGPALAGVVVSASGPSASTYPVGKKIADDERIVLRQGDTLTVLDEDGTRVLRGAGTYTLAQQSGRARSGTFAVLTRQRSAQRMRTGAVRVGDGSEPVTRPVIWYVDVASPGTHCLAGPDSVRLWRATSEGDASYTIRSAAGGSPATVSFEDGEMLVPWKATAFAVDDGASFVIAAPDKPEVSVTFKLLGEVPDDAEALAERLIANGCANQLQLLSTALLVDEGGEGAQPG